MKAEYINPFVESVFNLFSTMLECEVKRGDLRLAGTQPFHGDITALIGLSGPARGTVALTFPILTAHSMVGRLLRMDRESVADSVSDGVAELVNIVAGSAKAKFTTLDESAPINISLPSVVKGRGHTIDFARGTAWLDVPFNSELGQFNMIIAFQSNNQQERNHEGVSGR